MLGYDRKEITQLGGVHTAREIDQQPELWMEIYHSVKNQRKEIQNFLQGVFEDADSVILTGAGTSAYVGMTVEGEFQKCYKKQTKTVPTTHLVTHPADYINRNKRVLLISFARSGNSPESKAAVKMADHFSENCHHLIITCNAEGDLAKMSVKNGRYIFCLPEKANDKSLAMTSSFSGMVLAAILIANIGNIEAQGDKVEKISQQVRSMIDTQINTFKEIAAKDFNRAVFLGSGPLYGIAKESQLKMQELTDGIVVGKYDSFLGLRHGPKAVIDNNTLMCYHFSNDRYVQKYEFDLAKSVREVSQPAGQLGIGSAKLSELDLDWHIPLMLPSSEINESYLAVASVVPSQIIAFFKSLHLGLSPDNPSRNGAISRVVEGVNIYEI